MMYTPSKSTARVRTVGVMIACVIALTSLSWTSAAAQDRTAAGTQALRQQPILPPDDGIPPLSEGEVVDKPVFVTPDRTLSATLDDADGTNALSLDIWYGNQQRFGHNGEPIRWVNVVGNVSPVGQLDKITYQLNGEAEVKLDVGSTERRLWDDGDFSVEIAYDDLQPGNNTVLIRARDLQGGEVSETVTLNYTANQTTPIPYNANWGNVDAIEDVAQVTDGLWVIQNGLLVPLQLGYDRLVVIGDINWTSFEVTVPVTVNALSDDPAAYDPTSGGPGVGIITRWQGHYKRGADQQLANGWQEFGSLDWFRWLKNDNEIIFNLQRLGADTSLGSSSTGLDPNDIFGTTYYMKAQVQNSGQCGGDGLYRFKVWKATETEPSSWNREGCETDTAGNPSPPTGSLALVAHHADVTFGPVVVTELNAPRHTLAVASGGNGSVAVQPVYQDYADQQEIVVTATPDAGYSFIGWSGDISSSDNPLVFNIDQDTTLTANFAQASFTIDTSPVGQGSIVVTPNKPVYADGESVTLTAVPAPGWRFVGWGGDASGTAAEIGLVINRSITVSATFEQELYTLSTELVDENGISVPQAGAVNVPPPANGTGYSYDEVVQVRALAAPGWTFIGWEGLLTGNQNPATLTVKNSGVIRAIFRASQAAQFTLDTSVQGEGVITVSSEGPYDFNTVVQVSAKAALNWRFARWEGDVPAGLADQTQLSITMDSNRALVAVFERSNSIYLPTIRR